MSERSDRLKKDLDALMAEWMFGDEGRILIAPTKSDVEKAKALVADIPEKDLLTELGVVAGSMAAEAILRAGKRPADYWRVEDIHKDLAARLSKALASNPEAFATAIKASLKGGG